MEASSSLNRRHPICAEVLGLVTDVERCLREISKLPADERQKLHNLIQEQKYNKTLSDWWGVHSARHIRNRIAHIEEGESPLTIAEVERAKLTFEHALRDLLPKCSQHLQDEIGPYLAAQGPRPVPVHPISGSPKPNPWTAPGSSNDTLSDSRSHRPEQSSTPPPQTADTFITSESKTNAETRARVATPSDPKTPKRHTSVFGEGRPVVPNDSPVGTPHGHRASSASGSAAPDRNAPRSSSAPISLGPKPEPSPLRPCTSPRPSFERTNDSRTRIPWLVFVLGGVFLFAAMLAYVMRPAADQTPTFLPQSSAPIQSQYSSSSKAVSPAETGAAAPTTSSATVSPVPVPQPPVPQPVAAAPESAPVTQSVGGQSQEQEASKLSKTIERDPYWGIRPPKQNAPYIWRFRSDLQPLDYCPGHETRFDQERDFTVEGASANAHFSSREGHVVFYVQYSEPSEYRDSLILALLTQRNGHRETYQPINGALVNSVQVHGKEVDQYLWRYEVSEPLQTGQYQVLLESLPDARYCFGFVTE